MARVRVIGPDQYCEVKWPRRELTYPECPYYKELPYTGIDGRCTHPDRPSYTFCGTMHIFTFNGPFDIKYCPFDLKHELAKDCTFIDEPFIDERLVDDS